MNKREFYTLFVASFLLFYYTVALYFIWNWLIPDIFSLRSIGLLESLGLVLMSRCLFNQQQPPVKWYLRPKKQTTRPTNK